MVAVISLAEVKSYLRVVGQTEDTAIQDLMTTAGQYIQQKTSKTKLFTGEIEGERQYTPLAETPLFKQAVKMLVAHWYENRGETISSNISARNPMAVDDLIKSIDLAAEYEE